MLLTILLGLLGIQSARKGWELHKKEEAEKKKISFDSPKVEHIDKTPQADTSVSGKVNKSTLSTRPTVYSEITEEDNTGSNFV